MHRSDIVAVRVVDQMAPVRCSANERVAEGESMQRRKVMAVAAAGVLAALVGKSGAAQAEEEKPKPGSKEALKKYANICVSQPTASICHG